MEKNEGKWLAQRREIQPEEVVDWSILSYEDKDTSDEDDVKEHAVRFIYKKKKKRLHFEKPNQQIIKDLVINIEDHVPEKQPNKDGYWMKLLIKEAFKNIKPPTISSAINYSGISDPKNSWVSCQI